MEEASWPTSSRTRGSSTRICTAIRTFHSFNKIVLFAILHITLVLGSLALAFLGHAPVFATLLGIGGTVALLAIFAVI